MQSYGNDECRHNLICPGWSAAYSAALSPVPRFIIAVTSGCPRPGPRPGPPCGAPAPPATLPAGAGHTTIQQGGIFSFKIISTPQISQFNLESHSVIPEPNNRK